MLFYACFAVINGLCSPLRLFVPRTSLSLRQAARAQQTIRAQTADDELASSLSISPGDPVLFIERIVYSQNDIPFEFLRMVYRADRYELQNEVKRDF